MNNYVCLFCLISKRLLIPRMKSQFGGSRHLTGTACCKYNLQTPLVFSSNTYKLRHQVALYRLSGWWMTRLKQFLHTRSKESSRTGKKFSLSNMGMHSWLDGCFIFIAEWVFLTCLMAFLHWCFSRQFRSGCCVLMCAVHLFDYQSLCQYLS